LTFSVKNTAKQFDEQVGTQPTAMEYNQLVTRLIHDWKIVESGDEKGCCTRRFKLFKTESNSPLFT